MHEVSDWEILEKTFEYMRKRGSMEKPVIDYVVSELKLEGTREEVAEILGSVSLYNGPNTYLPGRPRKKRK